MFDQAALRSYENKMAELMNQDLHNVSFTEEQLQELETKKSSILKIYFS
jgi:hypothetical protein